MTLSMIKAVSCASISLRFRTKSSLHFFSTAFGCTLTLQLVENPTDEQVRKWCVAAEFRTKADAKIAVVCLAGREAVEFVRFKGGPVPGRS